MVLRIYIKHILIKQLAKIRSNSPSKPFFSSQFLLYPSTTQTNPSSQLIDLNNVPLTSGTAYIKWSLPATSASEHSGHTSRSPIKEHKVLWDYTRTIPLRLTIDKNNHLTECLLHLEVIQEYHSGNSAKGERVTLGQVTLNLAEYVDESEVEGDEGVVRRYLMQESKINSTAKIGICMRQTEGERGFVAPVLKSAPVFGGIAGIMKGENGEGDDVGSEFHIYSFFLTYSMTLALHISNPEI